MPTGLKAVFEPVAEDASVVTGYVQRIGYTPDGRNVILRVNNTLQGTASYVALSVNQERHLGLATERMVSAAFLPWGHTGKRIGTVDIPGFGHVSLVRRMAGSLMSTNISYEANQDYSSIPPVEPQFAALNPPALAKPEVVR